MLSSLVIESFITWCSDTHLKLSTSNTKDLPVGVHITTLLHDISNMWLSCHAFPLLYHVTSCHMAWSCAVSWCWRISWLVTSQHPALSAHFFQWTDTRLQLDASCSKPLMKCPRAAHYFSFGRGVMPDVFVWNKKRIPAVMDRQLFPVAVNWIPTCWRVRERQLERADDEEEASPVGEHCYSSVSPVYL